MNLPSKKPTSFGLAFLLVAFCVTNALAAPDYSQSILRSIFPAGAGKGTTVEVQFHGAKGAFSGADEILIDGPPGVTADKLKLQGDVLKASLTVAPDAVAGRRMVRVKGGPMGLTNFRWFFVGPTDELIETEKNNTLQAAQQTAIPVVINGQVNPQLDQDCFRFAVKSGQRLAISVVCHGLDAMGYERDTAGFADTSLELLDESGRVLAASGDAIGFDPFLDFTAKEDGNVIARVSGMGYKGFAAMVYRLSITESYPLAVFPPGGRIGEEVAVTFDGVQDTPTEAIIPASDQRLTYINAPDELGGINPLPFVRGMHPEQVIRQGADTRETAIDITVPVTLNGRFRPADPSDWFKLTLKKKESIRLAVMAQRTLRSPVDTLLEVFDASGKLVSANDDGAVYATEVSHDFIPFDSHLEFTAKSDGEYWIQISDQSGADGPRAIYRLTVEPGDPDFRIFQWPDALPIFGPGSTSALVVETHRLGGLTADIELSVEGLPEGWAANSAPAQQRDYRLVKGAFGAKSFLTITAPENVQQGEIFEFTVVGRSTVNGNTIEHRATILTHYNFGEPNRFRTSTISRVVIAPPQPLRLATPVTEITAAPGDRVTIPVRVDFDESLAGAERSFSFNKGAAHFKCAIGSPVKAKLSGDTVNLELVLPAKFPAGDHFILAADFWTSETRKGLPGPCTPLIRLHVTDPAANK